MCTYAHLFMRIDIYMTFNAFLTHISPAVSRHPFALAFGTFVLSEASFLSLIRRQTLALWTCLELVVSFSRWDRSSI